MKTRFILVVAVLVLLTTVSSVLAQDQVTLRIMHWKDNVIDGTPWWDEIVNNFEAAHPGVTIETNWVTFDQYLPTLEAMIAGEELPDVFFGHVKALELGRAGIAVNFAEVLPPEYFERFFPGPLRQFTTSDGAIYALPLTAQMFGIFVNPTIMEELGLEPAETWDELIEMAPTIRDAGYIPLVWGNGGGGTCPDFVLPLITQYGGDVYALDDLTDPDVTWDSEPVINALALLQRLAEAGVFVDGINGVTETQANEIAYQGRAAMLYTGSWMPGVIPLEAPPEYAESYYVVKVPALTADDVHWSGDGSGDAWVVNNGSPNRDLGIEFVQYLLGDEAYPTYIGGSQDMPSSPSALEYLENDYVKEMASWLETDGADHILFGQGSWAAVSNVCSAILDSSMTPEDGAAQIQADVMATRSRS
jgi:raffinose/stachyose/melibiose transport system substrate-binding protein